MTALYSVVRFSPLPEQTEHVNVALLFSDPRVGLVYDEKFPKLTCIAPTFDTEFLVEYLTLVLKPAAARDFKNAAAHVLSVSTQFKLEAPRELTEPLTRNVLASLKRAFLSKQPHSHRAETATERRRIERKLDTVLGRFGDATRRWVKSAARPANFLGPEALARLDFDSFRVPRVVSTSTDLIALDGVDLAWNDDTLERRAYHIGLAFDTLSKVSSAVRQYESRDMSLATIVFGEARSARQQHAIKELGQYGLVLDQSLNAAFSDRLRVASAALTISQ